LTGAFCKHLYISVFIAGVGEVQDLLLQAFCNKKGCHGKQKDSSARQKVGDVFKIFLFFFIVRALVLMAAVLRRTL